MASRLPLESMTIEEKLQEMEALWEDLTRRARPVDPPAWHADVLAQRQAAIDAGEEQFVDWEVAKEQIKQALHENTDT